MQRYTGIVSYNLLFLLYKNESKLFLSTVILQETLKDKIYSYLLALKYTSRG